MEKFIRYTDRKYSWMIRNDRAIKRYGRGGRQAFPGSRVLDENFYECLEKRKDDNVLLLYYRTPTYVLLFVVDYG